MPSRRGPYRLDLRRIDLADDTGGLPWSLLDAIKADGGMWFGGDWYTDPEELVAQAHVAGALALRLDCRDLAFLDRLPDLRYLHLRTEGRPPLEPIASLRQLRALIIEVGSLNGTLDLASFPGLRWLRINLGGKGGQAMLPTMAAGHPGLEWLAVSESRSAAVDDVIAPFPSLRAFTIRNADRIRRLGRIDDAGPGLRMLDVEVVGLRSLEGLEGAPGIEALSVWSSPVRDIAPVRALRSLRGARLWTPGLVSIEPLRGLPDLRFLDLVVDGEPDRAVLDSLPSLVAVDRGRQSAAPLPWPELRALESTHPLREEWARLRLG